MTYNVFGGTLSLTQSINQGLVNMGWRVQMSFFGGRGDVRTTPIYDKHEFGTRKERKHDVCNHMQPRRLTSSLTGELDLVDSPNKKMLLSSVLCSFKFSIITVWYCVVFAIIGSVFFAIFIMFVVFLCFV